MNERGSHFPTLALLFLLTLVMAACGGRQGVDDALDAAARSMQLSDREIRCAEEEYAVAQDLFRQAEEARDARDFARSRELAGQAEEQALLARELAAQRGPDCDDEDDGRGTPPTPTTTAPIDPDEPIDWDDVDTESLGPVFFDFDSYAINAESARTLESHVRWLRDASWRQLIIQGHTDDRGSTEYNLALGERRARAVRTFLERLGIDRERMVIISFGKEMPVGSHDENRRVDFIVR